MIFELSNALANFQDFINKILTKKLGIFIIIYLDNILIYTKNKSQDHMEVVQLIWNLLEKNRLFAILAKCQFY